MDTDKVGASTTAMGPAQHGVLHYARRGEPVEDVSSVDSDIVGFDAEKMKGRSLLTESEEKKLMWRVDRHLMTLCSIMFLLKNIDANNVCPDFDRRYMHLTLSLLDCKCSHHEQRHQAEHSHTAGYELERLQFHNDNLLRESAASVEPNVSS